MSFLPDRLSHQRMLHREGRRHDPELWSDVSPHGMVVTAHYLATAAGVEILERGGNAIDAAIAVSLALGVCEPAGSGLGGMTMMIIHEASSGRTFVVQGPCRAPRSATPDKVSQSSRYHGFAAVAVPASAAVLGHVLKQYGTMSLDELIAPAILLAEEGVPVTRLQNRLTHRHLKALQKRSAAQFILDEAGRPRSTGTPLRQPVLGRTLRRLAAAGLEDFYQGEIARRICSDMKENGGFVEKEDLERMLEPRESEPIRLRLPEGVAMTLGPPGGGLSLLQMLSLLSMLPGGDLDLQTPDGLVLLAGIIRRVREDRRRYRLRIEAEGLGEAVELLSHSYTRQAVREILTALDTAADDSKKARPRETKGETSHVCIADSQGNVVSMTQSLERSFGACVASPKLGVIYNGYLRAFKVQNRRHPHYLRPGAPARSNAAPTIILRHDQPWIAIGSTGSERMLSGMFEVLVRLRRDSAFAAVHAPRLHCTPEGVVLWEQARFSTACAEALVAKGFELRPLGPYAFQVGGLQLLVREGDAFTGVSEPRRDGAAAGPREYRGGST